MGKIAINIATGSLQQEEVIVGIDLGTTNSLVALIHPDTKKSVPLDRLTALYAWHGDHHLGHIKIVAAK